MTEPETPTTEAKDTAPQAAKPWLKRLGEYKTAIEEKWAKERQNLDRLYSREDRADSADREYAIFWANLEVLKPAVYARPPVPVVAPRFKDRNRVATAASETLERTLITTFEQADLDTCMREVRDERLRYGRGTGWVRLAGNDDKVEFDFVAAEDFAHSVSRTWAEVWWVARRSWLTRDQGEKRFGETFAQVPLKKQDPNSAVYDPEDKGAVWEIWCRTSRMVYWVAEDHDDILDKQPPLYDLAHFWPCPKPAFGTLVPRKLKPCPDIKQYKDQIEEINDYTQRIAALSDALRLRGFYAAGASEIGEAIESAMKSLDDRATLIPISSMGSLGPGGMKEAISWVPVDQVAALVSQLVELRRVVIEDVYQITGISDIVRGSTEASETATAQQIKSQWGSIRIRDTQNELARFARDMTRIAAEIISENFPPETLREMSQSQLPDQMAKMKAQQAVQMAQQQGQPPPPEAVKVMQEPSFEDVVAFLSNDRARGFVIEIETDSTIQPDEDAEKQRRVEFVTAVGGLFQQAVPVIQAAPQIGPFIAEVLKFAAAGFRAGRPLEQSIDDFAEQLKQMAQPTEPDPIQAQLAQVGLRKEAAAAAKLEAEAQKTQAETQAIPAKLIVDADKQQIAREGMQTDQVNAERDREDAAQERAIGQANIETDRAMAAEEKATQATEGQDIRALLAEAMQTIVGEIQAVEQRMDQKLTALTQGAA